MSSWGLRWLAAAGFRENPGRRGGRRAGRIVSFSAGPDGARAELTGLDGRRREASIQLPSMTDEDRAALLEALAGKARFAAALLSGEIPDGLEESLPSGAPLFPSAPEEVEVSCTCGGAEGRCEHVERLQRLLAERLDRDPVVLLEMRGLPRAVLVDRLRGEGRPSAASPLRAPSESVAAARGAAFPREPIPEVRPDLFFKPARPSATLRIPLGPPENPEAVLTLLGPPPLVEAEARELLVDLHRAVGVGARERLSEWEWRRTPTRRGQGSGL